jgi:hypothetical protein
LLLDSFSPASGRAVDERSSEAYDVHPTKNGAGHAIASRDQVLADTKTSHRDHETGDKSPRISGFASRLERAADDVLADRFDIPSGGIPNHEEQAVENGTETPRTRRDCAANLRLRGSR